MVAMRAVLLLLLPAVVLTAAQATTSLVSLPLSAAAQLLQGNVVRQAGGSGDLCSSDSNCRTPRVCIELDVNTGDAKGACPTDRRPAFCICLHADPGQRFCTSPADCLPGETCFLGLGENFCLDCRFKSDPSAQVVEPDGRCDGDETTAPEEETPWPEYSPPPEDTPWPEYSPPPEDTPSPEATPLGSEPPQPPSAVPTPGAGVTPSVGGTPPAGATPLTPDGPSSSPDASPPVEESPPMQPSPSVIAGSPSPPAPSPPVSPSPPPCIAAELLTHLPREQLRYAQDQPASVLCDAHGSCATRGHVVVFRGAPMTMRSYCELPDSTCMERVMLVNSPRRSRALRVPSKTDGLQLTAFAARYGTALEERVLAALVRLGM